MKRPRNYSLRRKTEGMNAREEAGERVRNNRRIRNNFYFSPVYSASMDDFTSGNIALQEGIRVFRRLRRSFYYLSR